jgi:hypothetical protein
MAVEDFCGLCPFSSYTGGQRWPRVSSVFIFVFFTSAGNSIGSWSGRQKGVHGKGEA